MNWTGDATLWFQSVDRDQTAISYHLSTGPNWQPSIAFEEYQQNWVNLSHDFLSIGEDQILITRETSQGNPDSWVEGEDGQPVRVLNPANPYRHIELATGGSGSLKPITSGEWPVDQIVGRSGDTVFFTGHKDTPLERHLYSAKINPAGAPSDPTRITEAGKSWAVSMAPDGESFVGTGSSPEQPPQTGLYSADGTLITWINENALDEHHPYTPFLDNHTVPEYGTLTAEDGKTLYYSIQLPPDFDPSQSYPALVETYGGPHAQTVNRNWERLSDQYYSRQGYVVFRLDNRGMANRGKAFEDVIYRQMGIPEVRDLLLGVDWLKSQPFVDGDRVGIQGWSYGGYMTLMTILQAPEGTFAAAVAGAPVTDWALYDTFYTERYMDRPAR